MYLLEVSNFNTESTILSCYTGSMRYLFEYLTPQNFFKDYYIAVQDANITMRHNRTKGKDQSRYRKVEYPLLYIEPNYIIAEGSFDQLENENLRHRNRSGIGGMFDIPIFFDEHGGLSISGIGVRRRYEFNIRIVMKTETRAIDVFSVMKRRLPANYVLTLAKQPLELVIPKTIIQKIADMNGWNVQTDTGARLMRAYLDQFSQFKINDIILGSSGNRVITCLMNHDMLVSNTGIDIGNVNSRTGKSKDYVEVTLSMWMEGLVPMKYVLRSSDFLFHVREDPESEWNTIETSGALIRMSITKDSPPITIGNKSLIDYRSLYFERDEEARVTLVDIFGQELNDYIVREHTQDADAFDDQIEFHLYEDGIGRVSDDLWTIDWSKQPPVFQLTESKYYAKYNLGLWASMPESSESFREENKLPKYPRFSSYDSKQQSKFIRQALEPLPDGNTTVFSIPTTVQEGWQIVSDVVSTIPSSEFEVNQDRRSITFTTAPETSEQPVTLQAIVEPLNV